MSCFWPSDRWSKPPKIASDGFVTNTEPSCHNAAAVRHRQKFRSAAYAAPMWVKTRKWYFCRACVNNLSTASLEAGLASTLRPGTVETPGALRGRGVDVAMLTRDKAQGQGTSEKEYNAGDPPHRQFAAKLEGETCYGGPNSRGQSLATLGWRDGFVCRTYGWPESELEIFCSLQSATITSIRR